MVKGIAVLFEYETPKLVQISNIKIGVTQRLLQLVILIYVVCWVMIYEKGYQENDVAKSAVTTKVKGIGFTNLSQVPGIGKRSWDVADYIIPPLENNALFVITNIIKTERQSLSKCAESPWVPAASCRHDTDCQPYFITHLGNGVQTGKCIIESGNDIGSCEIYSWCPLENDTLPLGKGSYLFPMVYNYTLLIKNDINFEKFGIHRRNIQNWASKNFFNRFCPIFQFATIFEEAKVDDSIFIKGGVIGIDINWKCDLDWDVQYCNPTYSFRRLDDAHAKIASGFNFRYAHFYSENGTNYRDLIKAYGIRFVIHVSGEAGKFHFLPLTMNIGSGLALLGLAPTVCDIIALNLLRSRDIYQRAKFETIAEEQAQLSNRRASKAQRKKHASAKLINTEMNENSDENGRIVQWKDDQNFLEQDTQAIHSS
ncbi:unnamed protein product [Heterobilharzia americana]|nr:unnamed protein product [Heterobilharzia americana]